MRFREFYEADDAKFTVNSVEVTIKQVPMSYHERIMLEGAEDDLINIIKNSLSDMASKVTSIYSSPTPARSAPATEIDVVPKSSLMDAEQLKKFRVTMQHPRSGVTAKMGHYYPQVMYVFARNQEDAEDKVLQLVRTKLDPREDRDEKSNVPRKNYLQDIDRVHMNMHSEQLRTWNDFTASLAELSGKHDLFVMDYFTEKDLQLILNRAKKKTFKEDLERLTKPQMKLLKKVYFELSQMSDLTEKTRKLLDPSIDKVIKKEKGRIVDPNEIADDSPGSTTQGWDYWSVLEPKTEEEESELLGKIHTAKDVFNLAAKFGIPASHIRGMAADGIEADERNVLPRQRLYDDIIKEMKKMMRENKGSYGDYGVEFLGRKKPKKRFLRDVLKDGAETKELERLGISWARIMANATEGQYVNVSGSGSLKSAYVHGDPNSVALHHEANEFVRDLMSGDRPVVQPRVAFYKRALEEMLNTRHELRTKNVRHEPSEPSDDPIPFD